MKSRKTPSAAGGGAKQSLITTFLTQPASASRATPSLRKPPRQPPPPDAEIICVNSDDEEPVHAARDPKRETEPPAEFAQPHATHEDVAQREETPFKGGMTITAAQKRKAPPTKATSRKRNKTKRGGGKPSEHDPYGDEDHSEYESEGSVSPRPRTRRSKPSSSKPKPKAKKPLKKSKPALEEEEPSMANEENESGSGPTRSTRQSTRLATKSVAGPSSLAGDAVMGGTLQAEEEEPSASRPIRDTRTSKEAAPQNSLLPSRFGSPTSALQATILQTPRRDPVPERPEIDTPMASTVDATTRRVLDTPTTSGRPTPSPTRPRKGKQLRVWFLEPPPPSPPFGFASSSSSTMKGSTPAALSDIGENQDDLPGFETDVDMPPPSSQDYQPPFASQDHHTRASHSPPPIAFLPLAEEDASMSGSECDTDVEEEVDELDSSQDSLNGVFAVIMGKKLKAPLRVVVAPAEPPSDSDPGLVTAAEAGDEDLKPVEDLPASDVETLDMAAGNTVPQDLKPVENPDTSTSSTSSSSSTSTSIFTMSSTSSSASASTLSASSVTMKQEMAASTSIDEMIAAQLREFYASIAHLPPPVSVRYKANVAKGTCKFKASWKGDIEKGVGVKEEYGEGGVKEGYEEGRVKEEVQDEPVKEERVNEKVEEGRVKEEEGVKNEPLDEQHLYFDEGEAQASASQTLSEASDSQAIVRSLLREGGSQGSQDEIGGAIGDGLGSSPRRVSRRERLQNTQ